MNRAILRSFVFENCTCKYNYPAVLLPLWLATHVLCAAVPLPSLSSYSTAVSNLIPRLFSPILSYPHEFLLPPNHQNTSSPPRRSVLFWALRHALSLVSSFKLPSAFPFSRRTTRCRSLFAPSCPLSGPPVPIPRVPISQFSPLLLRFYWIRCALSARERKTRLLFKENWRAVRKRAPAILALRHTTLLFIFQPVAREIGFHGCVNMVKGSTT